MPPDKGTKTNRGFTLGCLKQLIRLKQVVNTFAYSRYYTQKYHPFGV